MRQLVLPFLFLMMLSYGCQDDETVVEVSTFTDARDGHVYKTVKIGNQIWMAENLAFLPTVSPSSEGSYTMPHYYIYGYEGTDVATAKQQPNFNLYGVLYNWTAAKASCPSGWHLPTDDEWKQLERNIGMSQAEIDADLNRGNKGIKLKTTSGWENNGNGTDNYGFSALPGGYRFAITGSGSFVSVGRDGIWWSATEFSTHYAWQRSLSYWDIGFNHSYLSTIDFGFSVRCVRD